MYRFVFDEVSMVKADLERVLFCGRSSVLEFVTGEHNIAMSADQLGVLPDEVILVESADLTVQIFADAGMQFIFDSCKDLMKNM